VKQRILVRSPTGERTSMRLVAYPKAFEAGLEWSLLCLRKTSVITTR